MKATLEPEDYIQKYIMVRIYQIYMQLYNLPTFLQTLQMAI